MGISMFKTRLISGIILVAVMLAVILPGGAVLGIFLEVISLIGLFELYRAFQIEKTGLALVGYGGTILYYALLMMGHSNLTVAVLAAVMLLIMAVYVFSYPKYNAEQVMPALTGFVYVSLMLSHIGLVREGADGAYLVWLIYLSAWGCDTCAYCVGCLFGKHKMAPVLSPKKSVEGAIGGILGAGLLGMIYGLVFANNLSELSNPGLYCFIICAVGGAISQVGDLAASAIKRNKGIKDYGKLIPGHGGIMDRFDSILFTAPIIYYLSWMLQNI